VIEGSSFYEPRNRTHMLRWACRSLRLRIFQVRIIERVEGAVQAENSAERLVARLPVAGFVYLRNSIQWLVMYDIVHRVVEITGFTQGPPGLCDLVATAR